MLAPFREVLAGARAEQAAVGAFTAYNLETATAVVRAAERRGSGIVLLLARNAFAGPGGDLILAALVAVAAGARVPACVQLDHVSDLELMERAFALGAGAAMADGARLDLAENIAWTAEAVELAARYDATIEAELGVIEGHEDVATAVAAGALTDPDQAAALARRSGIACLAVSIGNVHGTYREPPSLDWERLGAIRARCDVPLSLHGASGLPDQHVRRAIALGIDKVNVNTELRERYLAVTAERLAAVTPGARVLELNTAQAEAIAGVVEEKLELLG
jgi:tagatose 1,6-diphosphate aldolase GatY/KbaY